MDSIRYSTDIMNSTQTLKTDPDDIALSSLVKEALNQFGLICFWNVPTNSSTRDFAPLAVRQLRKYGGMAGWHLAVRIEAALAASGHGSH